MSRVPSPCAFSSILTMDSTPSGHIATCHVWTIFLPGDNSVIRPLICPPKHLKSTTGFVVDFGRETTEGTELLGIGQRLVDPLWGGFEINFLMDGCRHFRWLLGQLFPIYIGAVGGSKSASTVALQHEV